MSLKLGCRRFGWLLALVFALPAWALPGPGNISGYVRNSAGVPQMGAAVEILTATALRPIIVFTDERGHYEARSLPAAKYQVKVSAPSFLPTLRENIALRAGAHLVVNLTLNTLNEAINLLPARKRSSQEDDDWKWTLRSSANRPLLRVLDNGGGPVVVVSGPESGRDALRSTLSFVAGAKAEGFGGTSDFSTAFDFDRSIFTAGTLSFVGDIGHDPGDPSGVFRVAYSHHLGNGSNPKIALTVRRFAGSSQDAAAGAALNAMELSLSDHLVLADVVELDYGSELQTIQFGRRATAYRPFGAVSVHLSPRTIVSYSYATSQPTTRHAKGFDSAPADLSESGPRMSLFHGVPQIERAHHHEIAISQRLGRNNFQLAVYKDRIHNTVLIGTGDVTSLSGEFLPDVYSGTFSYNGGELDTRGLRIIAERQLTAHLSATLDYAYGGVLTRAMAADGLATGTAGAASASAANTSASASPAPAPTPATGLPAANGVSALSPYSSLAAFRNQYRHALAAKFAGDIPVTRTRWIASYRLTTGNAALTPVDLFNASPGQSDPYLNLFLRQPLPKRAFIPGGLEALVDMRNLLAQGYLPLVSQDGHTVYLVQSARSVRGGVAFTF